MDEEKYIIEVFFVNRHSMKMSYDTKEKYESLKMGLRNDWNLVSAIGVDAGVNFAYVTHYVVIQDDKTKQGDSNE